MKLGVAYNLFDGEELLESSIKSIRDAVDYICVIYQQKSYYGENASKNIGEFLNELKDKDLINEIHLYERDFLKSNDKHKFEREKRDMGLSFCKKSGCTHFMSMDTDEFYDIEQFIQAKDFIIRNKIETSAVPIYTYLKSPEYRMIRGYINPHSSDYQFFVPFIMKIYKYKRQKHNCEFYPCLVDPTRA
ncbi:MAG: hypothetical protein J6T41_04420, partial [Neisseriaceae bacterium]|nr:hypothetical protein [Neisseriaceae bacterium]